MLPINLIAYIVIYLFLVFLFGYCRLKVKRNVTYYNRIPELEKYQNSIFFIGDYDTDFRKRQKHSWREGIFYIGGICVWCSFLMIIYTYLYDLKLHFVKNWIFFSGMGSPVALIISLYLSLEYSSLFYFLKNSFVTSVCLCQTKLRRGVWLIRRMTFALIATIVLIPFFLLSIENYVYITNEKIVVNKYFSIKEEEYLFVDIQQMIVEKKCNKDEEIYGLACYIENEKGQRIDILNPDLGEGMRQKIFQMVETNNCEIIDHANLSKEDIERLVAENPREETIYKCFFEMFYNNILQ